MQILGFHVFGTKRRHVQLDRAAGYVKEVREQRKAVEDAAAAVTCAVTSLGGTIERTLAMNAKVTGRKRK